MGYSLTKLKKELQEKHYSDNGLVAWGQNNNFGAIGALASSMYTISQVGQKIVITPFTNKQILFENAIAFDKSIIKKAKTGGFWIYSSFLKIETNDGRVFKYSITQGKGSVKQILNNIGL